MDFGVAFCSNICRPPKPPGTKRTDGKQQKQAENCRNMQKSNANNNADIKTSIENLQLAERNQLQQTPSYKIGGGGARAARRIRIRRPRLAERGCKACQTFTRTSADSKASDGPRPIRRPPSQNAFCRPSDAKI